MLRYYASLLWAALVRAFANWRAAVAFIGFVLGGLAYYGVVGVTPQIPWSWLAIGLISLIAYALLRENYENVRAIEDRGQAVPEGLLDLRSFGYALLLRIQRTPIQEWRGNRDGPLRKEVHVWKDQMTAAAAIVSPRRAAVLDSGWVTDDDGKEIRNVAPGVVPSSKHDVELYLANILRRLERLLDEG